MKRVHFKSAESVGYFEVPDDAILTVPEGIQANNEAIEPLMLNAEEAEKTAKADMTEEELANYEDDNLLLLPTELSLRSERKYSDTNNGDEIEPLIPNQQ